ncbi:AAA family ATPase [Prochlorothrix hollandica]|uniref:Chromosome segregation protein SMC n=1 Tax=Prochlorothrix hollandica PCC 9006 = CALU 1027 TaxID=317619 RepID=A0A0M2PZA1_PROHO|nr:AAA family ATPase [Prochlorothrix hollandica]KKJ00383.1 chromosome segregation protein SMC [Prochlorothrix hollandica PCC 9006 = CALU 1027]
MTNATLKSVKVHNFKAIQDSKTIHLTPLTVFIGNNGSGKSSVIEALETYQAIVTSGLDTAMVPWRGFEHIRNQAVPHKLHNSNGNGDRAYQTNPIKFNLGWRNYHTTMTIAAGAGDNRLFIKEENIKIKNQSTQERCGTDLADGQSMVSSSFDHKFNIDLFETIANWQFLNLNPYLMGNPILQKRTGGVIHLAKNGSNIADYLLSIYSQNSAVFEGILEALQYVLPYARDLQPKITSELERSVYLQLTEANFQVPGWLFSTGTLRILALLAVLRHPQPPPLIVIEEIENGLDPRTIHLIVDEICNLVESGLSQVILTTHSPYLLDLLPLSQIVLVERDPKGQPQFIRPADQKSLNTWAEQFTPGNLYTMGRLSQEGAL